MLSIVLDTIWMHLFMFSCCLPSNLKCHCQFSHTDFETSVSAPSTELQQRHSYNQFSHLTCFCTLQEWNCCQVISVNLFTPRNEANTTVFLLFSGEKKTTCNYPKYKWNSSSYPLAQKRSTNIASHLKLWWRKTVEWKFSRLLLNFLPQTDLLICQMCVTVYSLNCTKTNTSSPKNKKNLGIVGLKKMDCCNEVSSNCCRLMT